MNTTDTSSGATAPSEPHYRMRLIQSISEIGAESWEALLAQQKHVTPFLSYAFLFALEASGSASATTGWRTAFISLWQGEQLVAAMPAYEKSHSYGEYVFDWAWANAYHQHGLAYYPKLLSAIPFTPVRGNRLLAINDEVRQHLITAVLEVEDQLGLSSTHILFPSDEEISALRAAGFLVRQGVQFHWTNQNYRHFDEYLASLDQKKRKNIRAERRKVQEAGIQFRHLNGAQMTEQDWLFFKRCYDNTYAEHHSSPYLNLDFFLRIGATMPQHIHLVMALRNDTPIAASLLIHDQHTLFGRYWGCIEHVPCLHFETAYYQSIEFCIANQIQIFEGGAQGEHKMARGFLPHKTYSAHHLSEPAFADAVARFLRQETGGIDAYISELNDRSPFRSTSQASKTDS